MRPEILVALDEKVRMLLFWPAVTNRFLFFGALPEPLECL